MAALVMDRRRLLVTVLPAMRTRYRRVKKTSRMNVSLVIPV